MYFKLLFTGAHRDVGDSADIQELYEAEQQLFYVACTPAGDVAVAARTFAPRSIASCWSVSDSSRPWRKRGGIPDSPTWAPTSAPVNMARAWFSPPPFMAWSTADSKSSGKRAVRW